MSKIVLAAVVAAFATSGAAQAQPAWNPGYTGAQSLQTCATCIDPPGVRPIGPNIEHHPPVYNTGGRWEYHVTHWEWRPGHWPENDQVPWSRR